MGGYAPDLRGESYTEDNIAQHLTLCKVIDESCGSRVDTDGPAPCGQAGWQNSPTTDLDRHLAGTSKKARPGQGPPALL